MLNYKVFGDADETLVILHGLFGSLDNWQSIGKELSTHFRLVLVDQRNHGKSPHFNQHNYGLMAQDLKGLLEDLRIEKCHVLGHSMGGKTAMRFAIDYPFFVDRLIVVDIAPKYYPPHHQSILAALNSVNFNVVSSRKEVEEILKKSIIEPMVLQFLLKGLAYQSAGVLRWKFNLEVIQKDIDNIGEELESESYFTNPTLFIKGDRSDYIKDTDEELIESFFAQVEIVTVKSAGHWLHAEQPQTFMEQVLRFLK